MKMFHLHGEQVAPRPFLVGTVVFVLATLMLLSSATLTFPATLSTHLEPEEGMFGFTMMNPYYQAVSERLVSSSRDRKCQAVFLPAFSQESAVYLQYDTTRPAADPVVVSLKMERQLWAEMHEAMGAEGDIRDPEAQQMTLAKIRSGVIRRQAPIDAKVAAALERVWNEMLKRVRNADEPTVGLDGEGVHFANFTLGVGYRTGKTWSPEKGTATYDLVELAELLREYPTLKLRERKAAAQSLARKAERLLVSVRGSGK